MWQLWLNGSNCIYFSDNCCQSHQWHNIRSVSIVVSRNYFQKAHNTWLNLNFVAHFWRCNATCHAAVFEINEYFCKFHANFSFCFYNWDSPRDVDLPLCPSCRQHPVFNMCSWKIKKSSSKSMISVVFPDSLINFLCSLRHIRHKIFNHGH